jgi:HEAT repeat protein
LKKRLAHPDPLTRVHAALALARLNPDKPEGKAGEKVAESLLGYRTHYARITAAEALWLLKKDERVVPLLVRALEESNLEGTGSENERYMAARALGRIGAPAKAAVAELQRLVHHPDRALAATAAAALTAIEGEPKKDEAKKE